jgi:nucleotide-binding universal stress UspA family protein
MTRATAGSVVVGYDGSPHAAAAVDWAAAEAGRRGVGLHLLYAADYAGVVSPAGAAAWLPDLAVDAAREITEEGAERARKTVPNLQVTTDTTIGSVTGSLVDAATDAALLVVGTRGHGELAGALLGSVAFSVSAHSPCPVVVVRGDGTISPGPERPVLVGVDGSPAAEAALAFAADTAHDNGAPLVIAGVWQVAAAETWEAAYWSSVEPTRTPAEAARRAADEVVAQAERAAREKHPGLTTSTEVLSGPVGRSLADQGAGAGLLVVGARGRGGFTGLLLGSVSRAVIHRASCPVAVVRA